MHNYLLIKKNKELETLSKELGFTRTFFVDEDFVVVEGESKKELLKKIKSSKKNGKQIIFRASSEELLRFALEKTSVDIVFDMEEINPKDSVHFVRGGLDQITCRIAAESGKVAAFSFSGILNSRERGQLLARMMFNIKLCGKYGVKMLFSNFSLSKEEMRSAKDLQAVFRVLEGKS